MNELSILAMQTSKDKTVTTRELAQTLGVDVRTIQRLAEKLFDSTVVKSVSTGGRPTMCFTEEQATAIKQEIARHHNLKSREIDSVSTELEENEIVANAIAILQRRNEEYKHRAEVAEQKLIEQSPKVEFYNDVADSDSTINMAEVAKVLNVKGIGRNNLFKFLRENNIFDEKNIPYQRYVNAGFFKLVEYKFICDGKVKVGLKPVVYQKGVDYINKLLRIKKDEIIYE